MLKFLDDPVNFRITIAILLIIAGLFWWVMFYCLVICRRRMNKATKTSIHQYLVRTAFCFEKENSKHLGIPVYWNQQDITAKAESYGLTTTDYIKDFEPMFNFDVESIPASEVNKLSLPMRYIVKKKDVEKFTTLFFRTDRTFVQLTLPNGEDPYKSYWLGTVVECECSMIIKYIAKRTMKGVKHANTCHVVRP